MIWLLACTAEEADDETRRPKKEQDSGDTGVTDDSGDTEETGDSGDTTDTAETPTLRLGMNWQIQLAGVADTTVDAELFDIEMFDNPPSVYTALQDKVVICYFSAGSFEDWRDDAGDFPDEAIGEPLDDWPGEYWLDITHPGVRDVMAARLDEAVSRGCHGVDPDNVDGYIQRSGFDISADDQLDFNRFLAEEAHARGLLVGLKNDVDQVRDLVDYFDFAVNEECVAWDECNRLAPFTDAGKPVFHIEYVDRWSDAEAKADEVCGVGPDLDTLVKVWDLDERRLACD